MLRSFLILCATLLPAHALDVLWTATGTVTSANSAFGVSIGNPVSLNVRYAPINIINTTITSGASSNSLVRTSVYHGNIRLRIEISAGSKQWVSFTETSTHPFISSAWTPFEVLSADPNVPSGPNRGDLITFRANSALGSTFEKFNYSASAAQKAIILRVLDFAHPYNLLTLGQFPDKAILTNRISQMTGQVYANSEATALNFSITPGSIIVGEYFPPVDLAIERSPFGGLNLTFTAESDGWYALYGSENLTDWIPLGFHPGLLNGKRTIIPPTNLPKRFFKVERVPPPF